jgi:urease accessory protein
VTRIPSASLLLAAALGGAGPALAHPDGGFAAGLLHPLAGIDHLVVALAIGLWAARLGGRALVWVPLAFVAAVAGGIVLGAVGIGLPLGEIVVGGSAAVLLAVLWLRVVVPTWAASGIAAAFALFHGHVHGAELGALSGHGGDIAGLLLATLLLHLSGIALGRLWMARRPRAGRGVAS